LRNNPKTLSFIELNPFNKRTNKPLWDQQMNQGKVVTSLESAISHLENSLKLLSEKREKEAYDEVWQASSDIEYCLFLLSLHYDEPENFAVKRSSSGETTIESMLTTALETPKETKGNVKSNNLDKAIGNAWEVRDHLLKVQEVFEKKRKAEAEKSSTRS